MTEEIGEAVTGVAEESPGLVEKNKVATDAILARLKEKAEDQVNAAMELSDYCRRLVERDGLSYRQISAVLGVAHTSVFRAVEKHLPLNVVFAAARKMGHQHALIEQMKARAGQ